MVENDDTIRRLVDGYNDLLEYLRKLVLFIPAADSFTPDMLPERIEVSTAPPAAPESEIVPRGTSHRQEDEGYMLPEDNVEWGKVTAAPGTTPVATIAIHPCNKDGTEFASAAHVTVYIKNDRSTVDLSERGWTTATILSFVRFPQNIGSAPAVVGVLVGEGKHGEPFTSGMLHLTTLGDCVPVHVFNGEGHVIGWYYWSGGGWVWESPWSCDDPELL